MTTLQVLLVIMMVVPQLFAETPLFAKSEKNTDHQNESTASKTEGELGNLAKETMEAIQPIAKDVENALKPLAKKAKNLGKDLKKGLKEDFQKKTDCSEKK